MMMAPQRVTMEGLRFLQTWEDMVACLNEKITNVGEVSLADDIKCSAVESMVAQSLDRHLQLNARRLKIYDEVRVEIGACFESCSGKVVRPRTRDVASHKQSTSKWERVQTVQSSMEHVIIVASVDTMQVNVGAVSGHLGTPQLKAKASWILG